MSGTPINYASSAARPRWPIGEVLFSPTAWPLTSAAVLVGGLTVYAWTWPGADEAFPFAASLGWIIVGGLWVLGVVTAVAERSSAQADHRRPKLWRWAVVPVLLIVTAALSAAGSDGSQWATKFDRAHPGMRQAAEAALANPKAGQPTIAVDFSTSSVPIVRGRVLDFPVDHSNVEEGYRYSPDGWPSDYRGCEHIDGPWYSYRQEW